MKVKTLISKLQKFDENAQVVIYDTNSKPVRKILQEVSGGDIRVCLIVEKHESEKPKSESLKLFEELFESIFDPDNFYK